jgi:hypothetical protein
VVARALSDEGDDPGLTDKVGPPVSEREVTGRIEQAEQAGLTDRVGPPVSEGEATAESDKQREGGDDRIGQAARGRRRADWAG